MKHSTLIFNHQKPINLLNHSWNFGLNSSKRNPTFNNRNFTQSSKQIPTFNTTHILLISHFEKSKLYMCNLNIYRHIQ